MRKSKEDTQKTKMKILEAAIRLFDKRGFKATKLSHIAEEAKLTRGAVYWHFKNKELIFLELLENYFKPNKISANRLLELSCSLEEVAKIFGQNLEILLNDSLHLHFMNIVLKNDKEIPKSISDKINEYKNIWHQQIRQILKNAKIRGEIGENEDLEILFWRLEVFFHGLLSFYLTAKKNLSTKIGKEIIKSELLALRKTNEKI